MNLPYPFVGLVALITLATAGILPAGAQGPLIPRKDLFGNPDRASAQISWDGKFISYVAPVNGVLNLWIAPVGKLKEARAITHDTGRGIHEYVWTHDNKHLLYLQDTNGDENDHLYRVDRDTAEVKDLTPIAGVKAQIVRLSYRKPNEILVGLNERTKQLHDVYRVDLDTGERSEVYRNDGYVAVLADSDLKPRVGLAFDPDFKARLMRLDEGASSEPLAVIPPEDVLSVQPVDFDASGKAVYVIDSRGRDKAALVKIDLASGKADTIAEGDKADVGGALVHPTQKTVQAVAENYLRNEWKPLDAALKPDFDALRKVSDGDFTVSSRTLDDRKWIVTYVKDDGPVRTYLYDRDSKKAAFLFSNRKALEGKKLAKMAPVVIKSRDGLDLVSYLTLPVGTEVAGKVAAKRPLPMVLFVHGGPWGRDEWGYNPFHQWLANRGYAVLSVNFRASTGFGKAFTNAGNREWAGKMHDDLLDATDWAVKQGIADPSKICIMGGSYGGYATLVGLTFTPDRFACGVELFGPSNLVTLLQNVPPYWVPILPMLKDRMGDPGTEEGRKLLVERSPLGRAAAIKKPLLIAQGANDARVKQTESDQIVAAMKAKGLPVTYVLYSDEGHGFRRPENNLSFTAVAEAFLAKHLGGRYEPIGDAFKGSTIAVLEGSDQIPGLKVALASRQAAK